MKYSIYPIEATNPTDGIMPPVIVKGFDVDVTKEHYLVEFKFASDFGIFRANGIGPYTHCHRKDIRKVFTLFTKEKAPKNSDDLMATFARKGYTITKITKDDKFIPIIY